MDVVHHTNNELYDMYDGDKVIEYNRWEVEDLYSAEIADSATRTLRERVNAFNNRYVHRVALVTVPTTAVANLGPSKSTALNAEKINLSVNGIRLMNFSGAESSAEKVCAYNSAWGTYILPPSGRDAVFANSANVVVDSGGLGVASAIANNASLWGHKVGVRVDHMELDYQNTGTGALNASNAAVNFNLVAETANKLVLANGGAVLQTF